MPASEVARLYREHKLHSGPGGPIVKNPKQAIAIQISMARKEGHKIPERQEGGPVPGGDVLAHQGELVVPQAGELGYQPPPDKPKTWDFHGPSPRGNPTLDAERAAVNAPLQRVEGFKKGGTIPRTGVYRLHEGEYVVPKSLAGRYREFVKGSRQQGGPIKDSGAYQLHQGEEVIPRVHTGVFPEMDTSLRQPSPRMQYEPRNVSRIVVEGVDEPIRKKR